MKEECSVADLAVFKILLHAIKYSTAVNGVLLGTAAAGAAVQVRLGCNSKKLCLL